MGLGMFTTFDNLCFSNQMVYKAPAADWSMQGGMEDPDADKVVEEDDGNTFFYQKWYELDVTKKEIF